MKKTLNHEQLTKYVSLLADEFDDDHLLLKVLIMVLAMVDLANGRTVFKTALIHTIKLLLDRINEGDIDVERQRLERRALSRALEFAQNLPEFDEGPATGWPAELPQQYRLVETSQEPGPRIETRSLGTLSGEQWKMLTGSSINRRPFLWNGQLLEIRSSRGRAGNNGLWYEVEVTVAILPNPDAEAATAA